MASITFVTATGDEAIDLFYAGMYGKKNRDGIFEPASDFDPVLSLLFIGLAENFAYIKNHQKRLKTKTLYVDGDIEHSVKATVFHALSERWASMVEILPNDEHENYAEDIRVKAASHLRGAKRSRTLVYRKFIGVTLSKQALSNGSGPLTALLAGKGPLVVVDKNKNLKPCLSLNPNKLKSPMGIATGMVLCKLMVYGGSVRAHAVISALSRLPGPVLRQLPVEGDAVFASISVQDIDPHQSVWRSTAVGVFSGAKRFFKKTKELTPPPDSKVFAE